MLGVEEDGLTLPRAPSRREFLHLGALTTLGLQLPTLLAAETRARRGTPEPRHQARSCLLIFMEGGPSHLDLFDMKPAAPAEFRGEFQPIATSVPGVTLCEHLPRLSQWMHHIAQIRSVKHGITDHNAGTYYTLTGRYPVEGSKLIVADGPTNFPPFGSVLAKLRPLDQALPGFVHLPELMWNNGVAIAGQTAGFLGGSYDPLVAGDPSLPGYRIPGLGLADGMTPVRLERRRRLLAHVDKALERLADNPALERMNDFYEKAYRLMTAPETRRAFDLEAEPLSVRERYGVDPGSDRSIEARKFGGLPHLGQCLLLARRLIEAGVRLVTVCTGRKIDQAWDTHRDHFPLLKRSLCPPFDRAVSALLEDLEERGLLAETLVVILGEFGRTPRIGQVVSPAGAARDGRDHWPYCYTVMFAGAGIRGGAVYGASDSVGAYPARDPVTPEDLAATIYQAMGIPPDTELRDPQDRPHPLIQGKAISALFG